MEHWAKTGYGGNYDLHKIKTYLNEKFIATFKVKSALKNKYMNEETPKLPI